MNLPPIGTVFEDRYRLDAVLGEGGYAVVYLARDLRVERDVALKILAPVGEAAATTPEELARRFMREAKMLAGLTDPHTITMYDFGEAAGGLLYLVFEYVRGRDLGELLQDEGPLPEPIALHIVRQILESLREAHSVDLLHRDLKPPNILIFEYARDPYRVKVLDFGLAKPTGELPPDAYAITRTGLTMGTPGFMSPEQLRGKPLTPASDLYSLGLLMYELLTGEPAVAGKNAMEMIRGQMKRTSFPLPEGAKVSASTREIVERLTAKDPRERLQTAAEVLAALGSPTSEPLGVPIVPGSPDDTLVEDPTTKERPHPIRNAPDGPRKQRAKTRGLRIGGLGNIAVALGGVLLGALLIVALMSGVRTTSSVPTSVDPPEPTRTDRMPAATAHVAPVPEQAGPLEDVLPPRDGEVVITVDEPPSLGPCDAGDERTVGEHRGSIQIGGRMRHWVTYTPGVADASRPLPLLLALDESISNGSPIYREFSKLAEDEGFVIVAPQSVDPIAPWRDATDVEFLIRLLKTIAGEQCIDPARRYAAAEGLAAVFLTTRLLCEVPFSAVGTSPHVAERPHSCSTPPRVPFIHINGENDPYLPLEGGTACNGDQAPSLEDRIDMWRARNRCGDRAATYLTRADGSCQIWTCKRGALASCVVDGGREWPTGGRNLFQFPTCNSRPSTFPYGETMWRFFEEHGVAIDRGAAEGD